MRLAVLLLGVVSATILRTCIGGWNDATDTGEIFRNGLRPTLRCQKV